jgi:hypothetical protein
MMYLVPVVTRSERACGNSPGGLRQTQNKEVNTRRVITGFEKKKTAALFCYDFIITETLHSKKEKKRMQSEVARL